MKTGDALEQPFKASRAPSSGQHGSESNQRSERLAAAIDEEGKRYQQCREREAVVITTFSGKRSEKAIG